MPSHRSTLAIRTVTLATLAVLALPALAQSQAAAPIAAPEAAAPAAATPPKGSPMGAVIGGMMVMQLSVERGTAYCGKVPGLAKAADKARAGWNTRNKDVLAEREILIREVNTDPERGRALEAQLKSVRTEATTAFERDLATLDARGKPAEKKEFCDDLIKAINEGISDLATRDPEAQKFVNDRIAARAAAK